MQTEEERTAWMQICDIYMTEESDDEDEGVVRRHQLSWASDGKFIFSYISFF